MRRLMIIAAAVAVLGLATAAVGGAVTSAQEGEGPLGTFLAKVADKLGVSEDELNAAIQDAQLEMIDEAVAEGRISEGQAERLRERVEEGRILFPPPHPRPGLCQRAVNFMLETAAQVLDMEKGQLIDELKEGKSLAEVAEAQGMSVEKLTEALLDQVQEQLDALVEEGKLTEEQAERIFQRTEENIDRIVNAQHRPGHGPCRPRPHRGPDPGLGPAPDGLFEPIQ